MNRAVAKFVFSIAACACLAFEAEAVHVDLVPSTGVVLPGSPLFLDVRVSDLGPQGTPPSIGSFDLGIGFDPSLFSLGVVLFGPYLGNPTNLEALIDVQLLGPGSVSLAEVSLLSPADLDALQPDAFLLASLSFVGLSSGLPSFRFEGVPLIDDAFGNKLVISEPSTIGLVGLCILGLARAARRRVQALARQPVRRDDLRRQQLDRVAVGLDLRARWCAPEHAMPITRGASAATTRACRPH